MTRRHALILLLLTAFFWSLGGLMIKKVDLHPLAIAGFRSAIAVPFLLAFRRPRFTWSIPQIGGACAYAGNMFSFVAATKLTTAANAILIQYTAPVYVAIFGIWFLKERPQRIDWAVIAITLAGLVLFFLDELSLSGMTGNLLAIVAGLTFAWMILCLRKQKDGSALESVLLGNLLTALCAIPFMVQQWPTSNDWQWLVLLGTVQTGLPYLLYTVAIRHVTAIEGVLVPVVEPLMNPLWALLFLGEVPGPWAMIGGVVILSAVTFRAAAPQWKKRNGS